MTVPSVKTSIDMPFPPGWSREKGCSHGKLWTEFCPACRIFSLQESLRWMEPQVQRDRAELEKLLSEAK